MAQADFTRIRTNIGALNALQSLRNINSKLGVHQNRLATGKRINTAEDDPAGLTIATKFNARSEGLKQALSNIGDAKSLLSVAESGLSRINDILIQMRNKAEAAASDTLGVTERNAVVTQMQAYSQQIDDVVDQTKWNGRRLIDGTFDTVSLTFQTGADQGDITELDGLVDVTASETAGLDIISTSAASNESSNIGVAGGKLAAVTAGTDVNSGGYNITVTGTDSTAMTVTFKGGGKTQTTTSDLSAAATMAFDSAKFGATVSVGLAAFDDNDSVFELGVVGVNKTGDYGLVTNSDTLITGTADASEFATFMTDLNNKLDTVSEQLSRVGALSGRLTFKEDQVSISQINVEASYNRIMNADMAFEQLEATKFSILQQTSITMLAQSNTAPQSILNLFQ